jgi:ComF family protein
MLAPLDAVIHEFKYRGRDDLGRALGRLMADAIPMPEGPLVVGLPLHRTRLRERGYNQAGLLARGASLRWGAPVVDAALVRVRPTLPQARLDHDRRAANVRGVFVAPRPDIVRGRAWILVDDVSTTGATLLAAARVLRDAGATEVIPVVLAVA